MINNIIKRYVPLVISISLKVNNEIVITEMKCYYKYIAVFF